jgi:hypothetical protein
MTKINLKHVEHTIKVGDICPALEPNVTDDCIFYADGQPIGFYKNQMPDKMCQLANLANKEFLSKNVPKSIMDRVSSVKTKFKHTATNQGQGVAQMSAILGSIPPKPMVRRPYPSMSSVHGVDTAQTFIKAMLLLAKESEKLIAEIMPDQYKRQKELFTQVSDKWKFGSLFTSSISNYNISAPYHRDSGNIRDTVNVIITKRRNSKGGNLNVPDYNATVDQCDNSILVYPAWRNVHGVTPIEPTHDGGYRNSLIFYALKAFQNTN